MVEPCWQCYGPQRLHQVENLEHGMGKLLSLSMRKPETASWEMQNNLTITSNWFLTKASLDANQSQLSCPIIVGL